MRACGIFLKGAKLLRVFYAIMKKGVDYDPKKMIGDIKRPAAYLQAA